MTKVKARDRRAYWTISSQEDASPPSDTTSSTKTKLVITERDRKLLSFLGTGGLASLSQLQRLFWPQSTNERSCRARLSELEKAGYLQSWFVDLAHRRGVLVFNLTRTGALAFFSQEERRYFYTGLPTRAELHQQFLGQEARLSLELTLPDQNKQLLGWKNEHQLRGEGWKKLGGVFRSGRAGRLPDIADAQALILDQSSGELQSLAVEIDGQYYGRMLDQKLTQLAKKGQEVLWLTTSQQRVERVGQHLATLAHQPPVPNQPNFQEELNALEGKLQYLVVSPT
jgi:hypothetical protein